ncbi:YozE family protein [Peribacillus muralis]|uniref:YozE family protein n=1 Tax=Peribacillus muralis TaxID=264697 RepID=UPI003D00F3E7
MIILLTYKEWLLKFIGVDLPIGDIAVEVSADDNFPNTKDYERIHEYLESNSTSDSFMRVFEYSYKMFYESTQKRF